MDNEPPKVFDNRGVEVKGRWLDFDNVLELSLAVTTPPLVTWLNGETAGPDRLSFRAQVEAEVQNLERLIYTLSVPSSLNLPYWELKLRPDGHTRDFIKQLLKGRYIAMGVLQCRWRDMSRSCKKRGLRYITSWHGSDVFVVRPLPVAQRTKKVVVEEVEV